MMGHKERAFPLLTPVSLESLVPANHCYRHLDQVLDLSFLRSERHLMRLVADRLSIRWYLGYNLDECLPDHSSLTRIRSRFGFSAPVFCFILG
jgi:Transposase domain (DUF772)